MDVGIFRILQNTQTHTHMRRNERERGKHKKLRGITQKQLHINAMRRSKRHTKSHFTRSNVSKKRKIEKDDEIYGQVRIRLYIYIYILLSFDKFFCSFCSLTNFVCLKFFSLLHD